MRHTIGATLNIRHNLSSSKGPKPLQLILLTTYLPTPSAFTLAFSPSPRLLPTRACALASLTFTHYIAPPARTSRRPLPAPPPRTSLIPAPPSGVISVVVGTTTCPDYPVSNDSTGAVILHVSIAVTVKP